MESCVIPNDRRKISVDGLCYLFLIFLIGCLAGWIYELKPMKHRPVLLFLLCVAATGVVEYIIGYVGIRFWGLRLWDYRGLFLNIDGIVCFRSVVSFGVLGLAFHYLLEPVGEIF